MHKRILVATNGDPVADAAVRVAGEIAKRQGDAVQVLAVLEPLPVFDAGFSPAIVPYDSFDRRRGEELMDRVRSQVRAATGSERTWPIDVVVGVPANEIAKASRASDVELVVMGIGRHAPADRLFGGETALKVSRKSPVPVLAVAPGRDTLPRHAVAGTDFSASSFEAARLAMRLLQAPAELTLAHVRPELDIPPVAVEEWNATYGRFVVDSFEKAVAKLAAPAGITIDTVTLAGDASKELLDLAVREQADLIACGSHGHGFVERFLIGSVATQILRSAPCSVLMVPAKVSSPETETVAQAHLAPAV
ncbi:MAG TPA: universal stress protein [Gemmatimonadaceae bacterium]|nr:universal stress protein [Gemmatimonadaceae bacterium]